ARRRRDMSGQMKNDSMRLVTGFLISLSAMGCRPAIQEPVAPTAPHAAPAELDRIVRIFASLLPTVRVEGAPPVRYEIAERMVHYRVPGVSVAVVDEGRIAWAQGVGVTTEGATAPITPSTLFEAGSISKPVAATATLRLVEQGKLSLDEDINTYLKS